VTRARLGVIARLPEPLGIHVQAWRRALGDPAHLTAILEQGAAKAQAIARQNLALAKDRMGFLPR